MSEKEWPLEEGLGYMGYSSTETACQVAIEALKKIKARERHPACGTCVSQGTRCTCDAMCECLEYNDGSAYLCTPCAQTAQENAELVREFCSAFDRGPRDVLLYALFVKIRAHWVFRVTIDTFKQYRAEVRDAIWRREA